MKVSTIYQTRFFCRESYYFLDNEGSESTRIVARCVYFVLFCTFCSFGVDENMATMFFTPRW
jgi:hypothetical protein